MAFGLKVYYPDGTDNITIDGRMVRYDGTIYVADNVTTGYAYPGILDNGEWFVMPSPNGTGYSGGAVFTGFDTVINTDMVNIVYHGGNAGSGDTIALHIYRL